jgi:hypothetical protein
MKQEEKELLLKDISGRLPYGLIVQISLFRNDGIKRDIDLDPHVTENIWEIIDKYHALPYLRPMSSMTEEERKEYKHLVAFSGSSNGAANFVDWLNKKMFAYRTIDDKDMFKLGIALKALDDMYKIKEK